MLAGHDLVLAVGAPVLPPVPVRARPAGRPPGRAWRVVTDDPAEAHRSPAELAVLADPAAVCAALAERVEPPVRRRRAPAPRAPAAPPPPGPGEPLRAGHVFAALADRLPADAVVVEESPSSRPELQMRVPARAPLGFLSAAMGGLGFALPGAIGVRMALPDRPVVAVVGDGASLYQVQALWSAARYGVGALFVVLANGALRDHGPPRRAPRRAGAVARVRGRSTSPRSRAGWAARRIRVEDHADLLARARRGPSGAGAARQPLVLEVAVAP